MNFRILIYATTGVFRNSKLINDRTGNGSILPPTQGKYVVFFSCIYKTVILFLPQVGV